MDSDDDFQSSSLPSEPSPPILLSKLKRLKKKAVRVPISPNSPIPHPSDPNPFDSPIRQPSDQSSPETLVIEKPVESETLDAEQPVDLVRIVPTSDDLDKSVESETPGIEKPVESPSPQPSDESEKATGSDNLTESRNELNVEEKSHSVVPDAVTEEFDRKDENSDGKKEKLVKKRSKPEGEGLAKKARSNNRRKRIKDDEKLGDWVRAVSQSKKKGKRSGCNDLVGGESKDTPHPGSSDAAVKEFDENAGGKTKKSVRKRLNLDGEKETENKKKTAKKRINLDGEGEKENNKKTAKKRLNLDGEEETESKKKKTAKKRINLDGEEEKENNKKTAKKRLNLDGEEETENKKKKSAKKRLNLYDGEEKEEKEKEEKKKKKDKAKQEESARAKKRMEKERQAYLEKLHAESQRLLRETRDATFKPVPAVCKPISSILEKIRRRKLEVLQEAGIVNNFVETANSPREASVDPQPHTNNDLEKEEQAEEDRDVCLGDAQNKDLDATCIKRAHSSEPASLSSPHENIPSDMGADMHLGNDQNKNLKATYTSSQEPASLPSQNKTHLSNMALDESATAFRPPINDTQDLFGGSQESDDEDQQPEIPEDSPLEEVFAPSSLAMNLMLDSAPPDDISDEEENKENLDPQPIKLRDPVKAFVDDEAEEEDDSDNDLMRFQDNDEEDGHDDSEELKDLIATGYEEKPIDNEMRDQLHQKWLEQQDAAATDNVLQRLKCGWKHNEPTLLDEDEEEDNEDEDEDKDSEDVLADGLHPTNVARINSKKAKQTIAQMFTEKDDAYLSSDDEETEKKLAKQRLLQKAEEHTSFLSPADDEGSREVFGLIKKLNVAPDTKRRAKSSSFFDMHITGGNSNSSSKSSFLGRASSTSLPPSSRKNGSSNFRSFIFGRDDSNSRSGISTSEASSDMVEKENRPTKIARAKFSNSQSKFSSQNTTIKSSSSSLLEVLRRSSVQSDHYTHKTVGQTQAVVQFAAFKSTKKSIKIEAIKR